VQRRLIQGADPDSTDAQGCTGVHHAAAAGHSMILDALSAAKASTEARNHNMETPLLYAAKRGCHAGLTWLLDHHASVNALDKGRRGAAVAALAARSIPCLTLLLGYGASAHQHDEQWGWCPLHWAAHIGDAPAVALLLDKRANPYAVSKAGLTPLAVAAAAKHTAVVELLSSQEAAAPAHCVWRAEQNNRSSSSSTSSSVVEACGEVWIGSAAAAKPAWASDREFGAILSINDTSSSSSSSSSTSSSSSSPSNSKHVRTAATATAAAAVAAVDEWPTRSLAWLSEDGCTVAHLLVAAPVEHASTALDSWRALSTHFGPIIAFLDAALRRKQRVLLHCCSGASTSTAIWAAYRLLRGGAHVTDTVAAVAAVRKSVRVAPAVAVGLQQLQDDFEEERNRRLKQRVRTAPILSLGFRSAPQCSQ
jgi:protein-tyrosine phosphatase